MILKDTEKLASYGTKNKKTVNRSYVTSEEN